MDYNFTEMESADIIERRKAIGVEAETAAGEALEALEHELDAINAELETRKAAEAKRCTIRQAVAAGAGETITKPAKEARKMTLEELRGSKEYVHAFADYIRTQDDKECRRLLADIEKRQAVDDVKAVVSTNANVTGGYGPVPVPTFIEGRVRTAWEKAGLMALVRKTYFRGNVQVGFERSADPASIHYEGAAPIDAENLTFGVVTLTAVSIKKMVRISDEAMDYGDREFLEYLYDEITYRIAKEAEAILLMNIASAPTVPESDMVSVTKFTDDGTDLLGIVATAYAALSDDAANPVIVMNKAMYAEFIAARNAANYGVDPFMGLPVYFNSIMAMPGSNNPWLIVGDFGVGAQANFPNGEEISLKTDEVTEMDADIVRILGRQFVGIGLVADRAFTAVYGADSSDENDNSIK